MGGSTKNVNFVLETLCFFVSAVAIPHVYYVKAVGVYFRPNHYLGCRQHSKYILWQQNRGISFKKVKMHPKYLFVPHQIYSMEKSRKRGGGEMEEKYKFRSRKKMFFCKSRNHTTHVFCESPRFILPIRTIIVVPGAHEIYFVAAKEVVQASKKLKCTENSCFYQIKCLVWYCDHLNVCAYLLSP